MKEKIWSILVICLLAVSIAPATVFAENTTDEQQVKEETRLRLDGTRLEEKTRITTDGVRADAKIEARAEVQPSQERQEDIREIVEAKVDVAKERLELARVTVAQARERFENAKDRYQETRDNIREVRADLRACQSNNGSERCVQARAKVNAQAKPFLENSADVVLEALNKVAARIEASSMTEEEKELRLAELDARIEAILEAKAQAQALNESDDTEHVREAATKIREAWKDSEKTMKKNNGLAVHKKLEVTQLQLEKLEERFGNAIAKLEEKGADVAQAQELYVEFQTQLDNASQILVDARASYESDVEVNYNDLVKRANAAMRQAHSLMQDARQTLRELLQEIKSLNSDLEVEVESETEVNATTDNETKVEA